jgi:hypothetical protein
MARIGINANFAVKIAGIDLNEFFSDMLGNEEPAPKCVAKIIDG